MEIKTTKKKLYCNVFLRQKILKSPSDGGQQKRYSRTRLLCNAPRRNTKRCQTQTAQSCSWHTLFHFTIKIPQTHGKEMTQKDYSIHSLTKSGPYHITSKDGPNSHTKYGYITPNKEELNQPTRSVHSADFDTPVLLMTENVTGNSSSSQAHAVSRKPPEIPTAHPQYYFCTDVHNIRTLPKDLLFPLQPGNEIQWAQITLATLEEFPFINDKLKLKSLMHHMTNHNTAHQAASAQLLQAIQDPTHNPLHAFFK